MRQSHVGDVGGHSGGSGLGGQVHARGLTGTVFLSLRGGGSLEDGGRSEPLSWHRQRNRQTEQELHQMSEKLTRRLEELDNVSAPLTRVWDRS